VVNLYTLDFYTMVREHLNPGGIFVQWLPTRQLSADDRGHLIRALTDAFPHAYVWQQLIGPTLLIMGTLEPLVVDVDEVQRRMESPALAKDAKAMGTPDAETFLSFFLLGDASTRTLVADYEPVTDDRTIVDYSIPHFVGSGFGFHDLTYRIKADDKTPRVITRDRIREYAEWADPVSEIIPNPAQAERVAKAQALRQVRARRQSQ
jgi:hypothetical protein